MFLFEVSHGNYMNMDGVSSNFVIYTDHSIFVHMKYFVYQVIDKLKKTLGVVQPLHNGLWRQGVSVPGVTPTLFFIRIQFIRILRLGFGTKIGKYSPITKENYVK